MIDYNQDDEDPLIQVSIERHSRKKSREKNKPLSPMPILDDSPDLTKAYQTTGNKQDDQDAGSNDDEEEISVEDDDRSLDSIDKL